MAPRKNSKKLQGEIGKAGRLSNSPGAGNVYVYCGIPQGLIFRLGDEQHTFHGVNTSKLVAANGEDLAHGKFGINACKEEVWNEIKRLYGDMTVFQSGLLYASENMADGDDEALDKQDIKTGVEQQDPYSPDLYTEPNDNSN